MNSKKKIMVVDDDLGILEAVKIILEDNNFEVIGCSEPREAMELVKKNKPNLVMLDLWMPVLSGEEICRLIKTNEQLKQIPVMLLSASNKVEKISSNSMADAFLEKPFEIDDLIEKVNQTLISFSEV